MNTETAIETLKHWRYLWDLGQLTPAARKQLNRMVQKRTSREAKGTMAIPVQRNNKKNPLHLARER